VLIVLAKEPRYFRREVRLEDLRKVGLVLPAVIGLVWPRVPKFAVAVFSNPIVEFLDRCSFMRVRNKDKVGGCCPWSRLYFLRRHENDLEP